MAGEEDEAKADVRERRIKEIEASVAAHKGLLRHTDAAACERAREHFDARPTSFNRSELEAAHQAYKKRKQLIEEKYALIMEMVGEDDPKFQNATRRCTEVEREGALELEANARLLDAAVQPAAPVNQAPGGGVGGQGQQRMRVNEALKPDVLKRENTPEEFRSWTDKFKSYHNTSGMENLPIADRHSYLYSVISLDLETALRNKMDVDTPIFADPQNADLINCIGLLRDEFLMDYPLVIRRSDYFGLKQAQGQKFSAFAAELKRKGREADLQHLTVDQLYVFRLISGTCDMKLKEKLLKMEEPTLAEVEREARAHEAATQAMNAMKKPVVQLNQATGKEKPEWQLNAKCYSCGNKGHIAKECKKKASLTCNYCKKKGHKESQCWKKHGKDGKDGKDGKGKGKDGKDRSRAPSRRPSRSPSRSPARSSYQRDKRSPGPSRSPSPGRGRERGHVRVMVGTARGNRPTPRLSVSFKSEGGKPFEFLVTPDTGATKTVISVSLVEKYKLPMVRTAERMWAANGQQMKCHGEVTLAATCCGGSDDVEAVVTSELDNDILMSWHDLIRLGVLPEDFPAPVRARKVSSDSLDWIKEDYKDVLSNELNKKSMSGPPMHIHMRKDLGVVPCKVTTARTIPLHWQEEAWKIVRELMKNGIIERVEHPTDWISPGFFVPKEGGKGGLRLVTDFSKLNNYVKRPIHPFPSTKDILQGIKPESKFFAKLDAVQGYFQIPLDRESRDYTTFLLPMGRFRYLVAPMGLNASSDEFCFRTDPAIEGFDWASKIVDDTLIQAKTLPELYSRIRKVLERCRKLGVTISLKKLSVGQTIKFAGHVISHEGVKPDGDKLKALSEFPVPKNITDLRSFIGLANQLGSFVPDLTHMMQKMRQLLRKNNAYLWLQEHEEEFNKVKKLLSSEMLVKPFDPSLPTELLTDASRVNGLGYMLLQREEDGKPRVIKCGSCALTDTQRRYATIELECLAIQWAVNKCDHYLRGINRFTVVTDHKPLLGVFAKALHEVDNTRLQRFREKLVPYSFEVNWSAGKLHKIADALSRAPVFKAEEDVSQNVTLNSITGKKPQDPSMSMLVDAAKEDKDYQRVVQAVLNADNVKDLSVSHPARSYMSVWDELSVFEMDGVSILLKDCCQMVVPQSARKNILVLLHIPHAGIVKTRENARQLYYWPGMSSSIKNMVEACTQCAELRPTMPKAPIEEKTEATAPMTHVGVDLFDFQGKDWLVMVDRYSGFPFVKRLMKTSTSNVTGVLLEWFWDWGFPTSIRSDGGPQFRGEFKRFCEEHHIKHEVSSPYNQRSNGLAESGVKNVKYLLRKCSQEKACFRSALLEWRNVPRADGISPSQLFLCRRQKTKLPMPQVEMGESSSGMEDRRRNSLKRNREYHDKRAVTRQSLKLGSHVRIQNPHTQKWDQTGRITDISSSGSYFVETDENKVIRRNLSHLREIHSFSPSNCSSGSSSESDNADKPPLSPPILRRSERLRSKPKSVRFDFRS